MEKYTTKLYNHPSILIPYNIKDNGERLFYALVKTMTSWEIEKAPKWLDMNHDIDFVIDGYSFSVKTHYQLYKYPYITFEKELRNSDNNATIPGNFEKCKAKYYVLVCPEPLNETLYTGFVYIIKTKKIKELIKAGDGIKLSQKLTDKAKATNTKRYYNDATNYLIPKDKVFNIADKIIPFYAIDKKIAKFLP